MWQDENGDGILDDTEPRAFADITWLVSIRPNPLTEIVTGPDLSCQARFAGDEDEAFSGGTPGRCGTVISVDGELYAPASLQFSDTRARSACAAFTLVDGFPEPYTPVSQSPVTGRGTSSDPFRLVTVVCAGGPEPQNCGDTGTDPLVRHEVSYVDGDRFYRTDVTVLNRDDVAHEIGIYQYGDCDLPRGDFGGFGFFDDSNDAAGCPRAVTPVR